MPRKRERKTDNYYGVFPERLRKIMEEHETTQQELADYLGKSRQAIGYYADGSSSPDWETLSALARYFGVSSDWLLGLSDIKSMNITIKAMCQYTGLSEDVISVLTGMSDADIKTVNFMIASYPFKTLISYMTMFLETRNVISDVKSLPEDTLKQMEQYLDGTAYAIISRGELRAMYEREAKEAFQRIFYSDMGSVSLGDT